MTTKKVTLKAKPTAPNPDAWVDNRGPAMIVPEESGEGADPGPEKEPMKRLTIDIPASLHRAVKSQCALDGVKIADVVREMLLQKYGNA